MESDGITADAAENLRAGTELHRRGDSAGAADRYLRVPAADPAYPDARHLLGLLAFERGESAIAEREIREAIALRPGVADYHYHLGNVLAASGRQGEASAAFRQALRIKPHDAAAWNNLGNALLAGGDAAEAEQALRHALKYDRHNPVIHCNLGNALAALERPDEAVTEYRAALERRPGYADAAINLAALYVNSDRVAEILPALEAVLEAAPESPELLTAFAAARRQVGGEADAEPLLRRALSLRRDYVEAWNNLATVLKDLGRYAEAEAAVREALRLRPDYALGLSSVGGILLETGRYAEAEAAYMEAVRLAPDYPAAHFNLGVTRLKLGRLDTGFADFEWRLRIPQARHLYPDCGVPLWQGEALAGKTILLLSEQGFGDSLQFIRYAPLLVSQGARVLLACPSPLHALFGRIEGVAIVDPAMATTSVDYVCPLLSLPARFRTTLASIPAGVPYLSVPEARRAAWAARFPEQPRRARVGLVWAGDPRPNDVESHRIDRRRSLPLAALAPLLELQDVDFYSLQKGVAAAELNDSPWRERIVDWSADLHDFIETGGLMEQLDLVVSVDTAVVHLAGALARPVWVLSRFDGCWRWMLARSDSPWYPTLRLFRQRAPGAWNEVVREVAAALAQWAGERNR